MRRKIEINNILHKYAYFMAKPHILIFFMSASKAVQQTSNHNNMFE